MDKNKKDQQRDHALYFIEDGDEGFSPERNKQVIENSIKKYEAMRERRQKDYVENIRERADAVATYLKSRVAEGSTSVEKYFGRKELLRLQGVSILNKMKSAVAQKNRNIYLPH